MLTADQLEVFAAAFSALGAIQLKPASDEVYAAVTAILDEWPLPSAGQEEIASGEDCDAMLAARGRTLTGLGLDRIRRSVAVAESYEQRFNDQDRLYGVTSTSLVPPFESVHRGPDGLVFDLETIAVREFYRKLDLQAPHLNSEPDDHIGLELNFLMTACLRAAEALRSENSAEATRLTWIAADFTRDHLLQWAPVMLAKAANAAKTHWVRGMEHLTLGAVLSWAAVLLVCGALSQETCGCQPSSDEPLSALADAQPLFSEDGYHQSKFTAPDEAAPLRKLVSLSTNQTIENALSAASELIDRSDSPNHAG